ncbi:MAG: hypothetical protein O6913_00020 [Chloroflexi bacterium]|nr:hypothetical protein [Chloroflexota bacterium]
MRYEVSAVAGAGLIGGVVMWVPLYLGRAMMAQMRMDLLPVLGTMVPAPVSRAMAWGRGGMIARAQALPGYSFVKEVRHVGA